MKKEYVLPIEVTRDVCIQCYMRYFSKEQTDYTGNMDDIMNGNDHEIGINNDDIWGNGDHTVY